MANYEGMILTKKGRDLQAKAEAGTKLVFTRVKIGDGQGSGTYDELNDLVRPKKDLSINSIKAEGDGLCRIRTHITNIGLEQGLFVYEIGLFAQDPNVGEILYGVTTATTPDYLPPAGGTTLVNHQFDLVIIIGNAMEIHANIETDGYVSKADFDEWTRKIERLIIQSEIDGRVPESNKGTFFDKFDGEPSRLTFLNDSADLTEDVVAGTLTLPIVMTKGTFKPQTEVIIMDDQNQETLMVTAVGDGQITVEQLVHAFKKGATIARSTAVVDKENQAIKFPCWGTYSVGGVN
ncbi:hypothetical protein SporoP37_15920 [Sporosarcina sp. P37]|uniref:hypothetical protein n=1 Tax=Sporosarcina sp. P35 TaxID=2048246 RepID=UPI000A17E1A8|nr:hypothetical protein [Sporosarcina sp. P35]ARK26014.1 hypothetical protein SporoP37_15920 [Sporosarcina sp. P37]PID19382.1 hypothetical protein CSV62_02440 [Sporosarcina sp. P35]